MKIGLYGLPSSGKSFILNKIDFMDVEEGSKLLRQINPDFDLISDTEKKKIREKLAKMMSMKKEFIMDGHYAFGNEVVFTEKDGELYDAFLYLYIEPEILRRRMELSEKNKKYLKFDISKWQQEEIDGMREYCHDNNKDFYVIDNPPDNYFLNISIILEFVKEIKEGFSCVRFAEKCANAILNECAEKNITLYDGDKTLIEQDSSALFFSYKTRIFDGNFYTGFQSWKQTKELEHIRIPEIKNISITLNSKVLSSNMSNSAAILTSGNEKIWKEISKKVHMPFYCGREMSADTKYFITKLLQETGKTVIAFGDSMNDYYMLKKADEGYIVKKRDGTYSRSLLGKNIEGLKDV